MPSIAIPDPDAQTVMKKLVDKGFSSPNRYTLMKAYSSSKQDTTNRKDNTTICSVMKVKIDRICHKAVYGRSRCSHLEQVSSEKVADVIATEESVMNY